MYNVQRFLSLYIKIIPYILYHVIYFVYLFNLLMLLYLKLCYILNFVTCLIIYTVYIDNLNDGQLASKKLFL